MKFYPAEGGLQNFLQPILPRKDVARLVVAEILAPGSIGWNPNSGEVMEAKAVAAVYRSIGNPPDMLNRIQQTQGIIENLRSSDAALVERFTTLIDRCDKDWNTKIDGFEAKVALSAPRTYWQTRQVEHQNLAKRARTDWRRSLAAFTFGVIVLSLALFSPVGAVVMAKSLGWFGIVTSANPARDEIADLLRRALLFGTLLAISVWWLRQQLRDLRSHEHLAEDAAERVTMIETYAAMRAVGLQDKDLAPILTALYRPAVTGLIDDSGPVLPIEVLMKGLEKPLVK